MLDVSEIRAIITKTCQLETDAWSDDTSIFELGIDSLGLASLIAHCEGHLSLELSDEAIMRIMAARTAGQIVMELQSLKYRKDAADT